MHLKHRQTCRVCGNRHLAPVIDLGEQFLQGSFVKAGVTEPSRRKIPTALVRCDTSKDEGACGLVQMSVTTPPRILYASYWYQSGISATMRAHLAGIVEEVKRLIGPFPEGSKRQVLDIACNDGTLLGAYGSPVFQMWGVDPSDIARKATQKAPGATIINDLFPTSQLVSEERSPYGHTVQLQFDAITSIAMFYDLEDPVAFARAIESHLTPTGLWVLEVAYLPDTLKQVSYDTIVGEHLEYYTLATLEAVMARAGLRIFRAELNDINGGSIKAFVCKADHFGFDTQETTTALNRIRMAEFDLALDTDKPYQTFREAVEDQRRALQKLVADIRARGQIIHQYGSSTKANTLLQFCGLDSTFIPFAAERSPDKVGARTLGTDIEIISEEASRARNPDYYLVGPWHFREEILRRERDTINGANGQKPIRFIFPLPKLEVVERVA